MKLAKVKPRGKAKPANWQRKAIFIIAASLPVIAYVFNFAIVNRHGVFKGEDWDYFAQSYESARIAILHYHQFPWWNPWMNGGQPLFANPQFGLFSIQTPLVLLFGTVAGLHYSILLYFLLGFWGMYLLLRRIGAKNRVLAVLLSYVWIFSGFNVGHLGGGQLTFLMYLLAPWAFLTLLNIHKKRGWLWFGLVVSLMILTAMHYITFEVVIICSLIAIIKISKEVYKSHLKTFKQLYPVLRPYLLAVALIVILCGVRIIYTLQFTHEFPRLEPLDPPESIKLFLASLLFRTGVSPAGLTNWAPGATVYGWIEYADYIGLATIALFAYLVINRFERIKKISLQEWLILIAIILAALITLGNFSSLSPASLLHNLAVFNQMRVPYRFVGWVGFGIILFLVKLPKRPVVYILLTLAVVDVFTATYGQIGYSETTYTQKTSLSAPFEQYAFFETNPSLGQLGIINISNLRLLRATQENIGEIYGYEPILNIGEYYYLPGTTRCGFNNGCNFVLTNNAAVSYWSPNKISLKRTGSGPIDLNMNPGKVWSVNGQPVFKHEAILELRDAFKINDPAKDITINFTSAL